MNTITRAWNRIGGRFLFRVGRVGYLTTTGRKSGQLRTTHIGFVPRADGTLLLGSGGPDRAWVANLRSEPRCRFRTRGGEGAYRATELVGDARDTALAEMRAAMGRFGGRATFHVVFALTPEAVE